MGTRNRDEALARRHLASHLNGAAAEVTLPKLPSLVQAPAEDLARICDGCGRKLPCRNLTHVLLLEPNVALRDGVANRHLPDPQLPKRVPSPHHHLPAGAQDRRVPLVHVCIAASSHLADSGHLLASKHNLRHNLTRGASLISAAHSCRGR